MSVPYLRLWLRKTWLPLLVCTVLCAMITVPLAGRKPISHAGRSEGVAVALVFATTLIAFFVKALAGFREGLTFVMTRPVSRASLIWTPWMVVGAESAAGALFCMGLLVVLPGHAGTEFLRSPQTWLWLFGGVVNGLTITGLNLLLAVPLRMAPGTDGLLNPVYLVGFAFRVPWLTHLLFVWPVRGSATFLVPSLLLHLGMAVGSAAVAQWWLERRDVPLPGIQLHALRGQV